MEINPEYIRLKEVADAHFGGLGKLASGIGRHYNTFSNYKHKPIGGLYLALLRDKYRINPEYIKYGNEPVFLDPDFDKFNIPLFYATVNPAGVCSISNKMLSFLNLSTIFDIKDGFLFIMDNNNLSFAGINVGDNVVVELKPDYYKLYSVILYQSNNFQYLAQLIDYNDAQVVVKNSIREVVYNKNDIEIKGYVKLIFKIL